MSSQILSHRYHFKRIFLIRPDSLFISILKKMTCIPFVTISVSSNL
jgi:hypothetical protein